MGLLRNLLESIKEQQQKRDEIDDDVTRDRYLRSLRRQRRTQLEEKEKKELKKQIKEHELQRTREVVLGTKIDDKTKLIKDIKEKKKKILAQRQFMIPRKKPKKGFLSKGTL